MIKLLSAVLVFCTLTQALALADPVKTVETGKGTFAAAVSYVTTYGRHVGPSNLVRGDIGIYLRSHARGPSLSCFQTYRDFSYSLVDAAGRTMPTQGHLPGGGGAESIFACDQTDQPEGEYFPSLIVLFGDLKPGAYRLTITFAPLDHSYGSISFPTIAFDVSATLKENRVDFSAIDPLDQH